MRLKREDSFFSLKNIISSNFFLNFSFSGFFCMEDIEKRFNSMKEKELTKEEKRTIVLKFDEYIRKVIEKIKNKK